MSDRDKEEFEAWVSAQGDPDLNTNSQGEYWNEDHETFCANCIYFTADNNQVWHCGNGYPETQEAKNCLDFEEI